METTSKSLAHMQLSTEKGMKAKVEKLFMAWESRNYDSKIFLTLWNLLSWKLLLMVSTILMTLHLSNKRVCMAILSILFPFVVLLFFDFCTKFWEFKKIRMCSWAWHSKLYDFHMFHRMLDFFLFFSFRKAKIQIKLKSLVHSSVPV